MSDTSTIRLLLEKIHLAAKQESFPIDEPVYTSVKKDPYMPILYAGNLNSQFCFFARDLGKDEVIAGQPLFGAAGRLVRNGLYYFQHGKNTETSEDYQTSIDKVLLTNTVPYKPIGNKAFTHKVKSRFRPFLESLLLEHWKGQYILPLGTEALEWFVPYVDEAKFVEFSKNELRFNHVFEFTMNVQSYPPKTFFLAPLPHPSPLNQKYYHAFPNMLQQRLQQLKFS